VGGAAGIVVVGGGAALKWGFTGVLSASLFVYKGHEFPDECN